MQLVIVHVHVICTALTMLLELCLDLLKRFALRLRDAKFDEQPCAHAFDGEEEEDPCWAHGVLHLAEEHGEDE